MTFVSIGPRLFRHGNSYWLLNSIMEGGFQLGHVFSDMEIDQGSPFRRSASGFQLGHVFSDMEMWEHERHSVVRPGFQLGHVFSDMEMPGYTGNDRQ